MTSLDQWVCRENIERFRALYAMATDERKRRILTELLAQEQAKLQERNEPSIAELLSDPIAQVLMRADGVVVRDVITIVRDLRPRNVTSEQSAATPVFHLVTQR